jgi:hypothetical protein
MRKVLFIYFLFACSLIQAQDAGLYLSKYMVEVNSPSDVSGVYKVIGTADNASSKALFYDTTDMWGIADVSKTAVSGKFVLVDDTMGVNIKNAADISGNIAVVYFGGGINFKKKMINVQSAGAIGVIIISDGTRDFAFAGGGGLPDALTMTLPNVVITLKDGIKIVGAIKKSTVNGYIGGKKVYDNDLSLDKNYIITPKYRTRNKSLVKESDVNDTLGFAVINKGTKDQIHMLFTAGIEFNNELIYRDTLYHDTILVGDTIGYFKFNNTFSPKFDLESGEYKLTYKILNLNKALNKDSLYDQYPMDNVFTTTFWVSDSLVSAGVLQAVDTIYRMDQSTKVYLNAPKFTTFSASSTFKKSWSSCVVFQDPNAERVKLDAMSFWAVANAANTTLKGELLTLNVLEWNDEFSSYYDTLFGYKNVSLPLVEQEFTINDSINVGNYQVKFDYPLYFENDVRYIACVNSSSKNVLIGYDNISPSLYPSVYINRQPIITTIVDGTDYYASGFGWNWIPSISLSMSKNTLSIEEKSILESSFNVYPNPATSVVNLSFKLENNSNVDVTVSDLTGKVVYSNKMNKTAGSNSFVIDTKGLTSGMYVVSLATDNGIATRRISIEK